VRTRPRATSAFRLEFDQQVWDTRTGKQMVAGTVQMVCVQRDLTLCALPTEVVAQVRARYPPESNPAADAAAAAAARVAAAGQRAAKALSSPPPQPKLVSKGGGAAAGEHLQPALPPPPPAPSPPAPPPHVHRVEVYFEDTDFTGVVYYANYLKFFERARSRLAGIRRIASSGDPALVTVAAGLRVSGGVGERLTRRDGRGTTGAAAGA
jgi:acyl-CoA thioesterase FadM